MGETLWVKRERGVRRSMESKGWWTCRAAGSLGDADILALKEGKRPLMIEVKATARGPWAAFGPKDRQALIAAAKRAGADPVLVWWPSRSAPVWFPADTWPTSTRASTVTP